MFVPEAAGILSLISCILPVFYNTPINTQSWFLFLKRKKKRREEERGKEREGEERRGDERRIRSLNDRGEVNKPNPS